MFAGTYTRTGESEGIYVFSVEPETGNLKIINSEGGIDDPSFLDIHPSKKTLYAVAELQGDQGGALVAFEINHDNGGLKKINAESTGSGPCHVSLDSTGKFAVVANYDGGSVCVLPILEDGSIGGRSEFIQHNGGSMVNPQRQEKAHAHSANISPDNNFVVINDLGMDKLVVYEIDLTNGRLSELPESGADSAPGVGPRHLDFHPNGKWAFAINEIGNTVTVYDYDRSNGNLTELQSISTLPDDFNGESHTADIHVHPNGKFIYGSNRGHHSLTIFQIDQSSGRLDLVGHQSTGGETPRNFLIHPNGSYIYAANQDSNDIHQFKVNLSDGTLTPVGSPVYCPAPVCLKVLQI